MNHLVSKIVSELQRAVRDLPDSFYCTFDYTTTCKTYTHPVTLGLLTKVLWSFKETGFVGVDVRLNTSKKVKFQPDLVVFDRSLTNQLLYADYESPNSCDTRIPRKDIAAYQRWRSASEFKAPYLLVTTLPSGPAEWELRYASKGRDNSRFKNQIALLRENPFKFWYEHYAAEIPRKDLENVHFINIDGKRVRAVDWKQFGI
jgi:hypothetical protein